MNAQEEHERRLKRWGKEPDPLSFDLAFCNLLDLWNVKHEDVAAEMAYQRRANRKYSFCSRLSLAKEKTRHVPLDSLPPNFPTIRLRCGSGKKAVVCVEALYPSCNYKVKYSSSGATGYYAIAKETLPLTQLTAFLGKPIDSLIGGMPDQRPIERIQNQNAGGLSIWVKPDKIKIAAIGRPFFSRMEEYRKKIRFQDVADIKLEGVLNLKADSGGKRMFSRPMIEYKSVILKRFTIIDGQEAFLSEDIYILAKPSDKSSRPQFKVDKFFLDLVADCYMAKASDVKAAQLAASMQAAQAVKINSKRLEFGKNKNPDLLL